jgi:O-antigen/teichoic acid export membrane protein
MSLIHINWNPTRKDIRIFGIAALVVSVLAAATLHYFRGFGATVTTTIILAGLVMFASCMLSHKAGRIIFIALTCITLPIGWAMNFVVLFVFYFLLITPLGLVFRLIGRDVLGKRFDSDAKSYWQPHRCPESAERYFRQF